MSEKDISRDGTYIFDTTDIYGKRVYLETSQYNEHIITGHPEMKGKRSANAMKDAVEDPNMIIKSNKNPDRWLYVSKSDMSTYPNLHVKAVVDHASPEYGYVVTGLFQKKVNVEKEGTVIYEKTDKSTL